MIILDPDLDPESPRGRRPVRGGSNRAPKAIVAKRSGASAAKLDPKINPREIQLPTARTLSRFLSSAQTAVRLKGQVTVLLTTDEAIRKLNRQFRGKNKATDVLSFPAEGVGAQGLAGDLAISVTTAMGQAAEQGHSLSTEIKVLVLHGLLHLAGYDHEIDEGKMARRERKLREMLKLPQGLIERAVQPKRAATRGAGKHSAGAKAQLSSGVGNLRAKARTLRGAKAQLSSGAGNVRAKARTLRGAKAQLSSGVGNVRAKARTLRGAKAQLSLDTRAVRLKPHPFKTVLKTRPAAKAKRR